MEEQTANVGEEKMTKKEQQELFLERERQRKQAEVGLRNLKKRLVEANEVKKLQIEEIALNLEYYRVKEQFLEYIPKMVDIDMKHDELMAAEEAKERKIMQERQKEYEEKQKKVQEVKSKLDIVKVKQGKARE